MKQVSLYDAKTHLSSLVDQAANGEEVIIAKNGMPLARLGPLPNQLRPRQPAHSLQITFIAEDFDETDEETIAAFNGQP